MIIKEASRDRSRINFVKPGEALFFTKAINPRQHFLKWFRLSLQAGLAPPVPKKPISVVLNKHAMAEAVPRLEAYANRIDPNLSPETLEGIRTVSKPVNIIPAPINAWLANNDPVHDEAFEATDGFRSMAQLVRQHLETGHSQEQ